MTQVFASNASLQPQHEVVEQPATVWLYTHCPMTATLRDGPGGFAVAIERAGYDACIVTGGEDGCNTSLERLELLAIIAALDTLVLPTSVVIRSNSNRLRCTLSGGRFPMTCRDLKNTLKALLIYHEVSCEWMPGDGRSEQVTYCRQLAEQAAQDVSVKRGQQYTDELMKWQEERERRAAMMSRMRPAVVAPLILPSEFPK